MCSRTWWWWWWWRIIIIISVIKMVRWGFSMNFSSGLFLQGLISPLYTLQKTHLFLYFVFSFFPQSKEHWTAITALRFGFLAQELKLSMPPKNTRNKNPLIMGKSIRVCPSHHIWSNKIIIIRFILQHISATQCLAFKKYNECLKGLKLTWMKMKYGEPRCPCYNILHQCPFSFMYRLHHVCNKSQQDNTNTHTL